MRSVCFAVAALLSLTACSKKDDRVQVWVYTSIYKEVLAKYELALKTDLPDIEVKWFQSGSENVASKVLAELTAGATKADLMMTSDMFFYQELKKENKLATLSSDALAGLPPSYIDADKTFAVMRMPVMVIAYNKDKIGDLAIPKSFKELVDTKYKSKLAMPSPLESGTALTTILYFSQLFGEEYFRGLRANEIIAQGGNGATLAKIQSGEKPIGIVLMENVLQAREKGNTSVEFVIPDEGALAMPSPVAVMSSSKNPEHAQRLATWFLQQKAQKLISEGWHYAALPGVEAPEGAPEWSSLKMQPWSMEGFAEWGLGRQAVKDKFQDTVLR